MEKLRAFLKRKNIEISAKRYGIDALGAMAQGLFCSLLIGTIIKTLGQQLGMEFLIEVGGYASAMSGAAMAVGPPGLFQPWRWGRDGGGGVRWAALSLKKKCVL